MNESYLQDLSREAKVINEKIKALMESKIYHHEIVCKAPFSEMELKKIDRQLEPLLKQQEELSIQAKEARLAIAIQEGITLHIGGVK